MFDKNTRLETLLKQSYAPAPAPDFAVRIIMAAHAIPQRTPIPLERIVPSLFKDMGLPAPILICTCIMACGFFVGLTSPFLHDMTDVLTGFGGLPL